MLLKTFKLESWMQRCASTALICHLRYATADTVIRKAFCAATRSKTIFVYFLRKAIIFKCLQQSVLF